MNSLPVNSLKTTHCSSRRLLRWHTTMQRLWKRPGRISERDFQAALDAVAAGDLDVRETQIAVVENLISKARENLGFFDGVFAVGVDECSRWTNVSSYHCYDTEGSLYAVLSPDTTEYDGHRKGYDVHSRCCKLWHWHRRCIPQ